MTIRKALGYSYLDRYASLVVGIVSSMVIARLLTPADIGVFSVTMVLLSFVSTVRDMGAGGYLVQEKELTPDRVRAVWAVQLGVGIGLALLVLLSRTPVAWFYHEPRIYDILGVVALNYAINPFGSLTYAWQIREMRFASVALVRFSATLAGALVSSYFAWRGTGPISLAYGALAGTLVNALMAVYFRPRWFPWLPGVSEMRRVLAYGTRTTGAGLIQTFASAAPELLLGKLQGMVATGLFSRGNGLISMFSRLVMEGAGVVCGPWFAQQSRSHGSISQPFLKATAYVTVLGWTFSLLLIFLAYPIIRVLYGDQWDGAVKVTQLLAGALACGIPASLCGTALLALGCASQMLRLTAVNSILGVTLMAIGASFGLSAMGASVALGALVRTGLSLRAAHREIQFEWSEFLLNLRASALVAGAAGVAPAIAFGLFGPAPTNPWLPLAVGLPGAALGFGLGLVLVQHPLREEVTKFRKNFGF